MKGEFILKKKIKAEHEIKVKEYEKIVQLPLGPEDITEDKIYVDHNTYLYIQGLKCRLEKSESNASRLQRELDSIKHQIGDKELKPAVSEQCKRCFYCVKSDWNGRILGCCKDCVCKDFKKEKQNE